MCAYNGGGGFVGGGCSVDGTGCVALELLGGGPGGAFGVVPIGSAFGGAFGGGVPDTP